MNKILLYQLYLLQIENYEIGRFWKLLFKKGYFRSKTPLRKRLVRTNKIKVILLVCILLLAPIFYFSFLENIALGLLVVTVSYLALPIYITVAVWITWPIDLVAKMMVTSKAKKMLATAQGLKIVGVAGSYGKTTMKNVLAAVLSSKLKVLSPPENINTPVGLSNWFVKQNTTKYDILIIEFGEEYQGDNKKVCDIFPPDMTVITGINEAHFERLGSIESVASTIFESITFAKPESKVFLNEDDANVMKYYDKFVGKKEVVFYGKKDVKNSEFNTEKLGWEADVYDLGRVSIPILGEYILADLAAAAKVAKEFNLSADDIKKGIREIEPVEHRLQPIKGNGDVLVIDDSYNGNPTGVSEAISLLSKFKNRRKVYLTPGLVETGKRNKEIHFKIGRQLAGVADKVILIKNSATPYILEGLKSEDYDSKNVIWFETADKAHSSLGKVLEPGDVILFQNDWGDQYL